MCLSLNLLTVEVELDVKLVVDLLSKANEPSNANDTILADCKEGLKRIPMIKIQHYYREANKCADTFAQRGVNLTQEFVIFVEPPADVMFLLNLDTTRVMVNHSVPSVSVAG